MRSSGMTWAAYKKHRDRGEYDDYEREQASSLSVVDKDEETRRRYQQYVQGVMASNYQDDIIRNQMMAPYLAEEERRRREEERRREEWQREHIAAQREQVQDGQSVANFDTQAARRKAEPKIRYEQAYDNWNAQNPEFKDKSAAEKYRLFANELDMEDASQGYKDFYNRNKKDDEFQRMSDEEKRRQYMMSLNNTMQENGELPDEQRGELFEYKYGHLSDKEKAAVDKYINAKDEETEDKNRSGLEAIKNTITNGINWRSENREAIEKDKQDAINDLIRLGWDENRIKSELDYYRKPQVRDDWYSRNQNDPDFQRMSDDEKQRQYMRYLENTAQENGTLPQEQRLELSQYKYDHLSDEERMAVDAIMEKEAADTKEFGEYGFFGGMQSYEYGQKSGTLSKRAQEAVETLKSLGWDDERLDRDVASFKELADYNATQELNNYYNIDPNASSKDKFLKSLENTAVGVYTAPARGMGSLLSENGAYGRNLSSKYRYPVNMSNEAYRQVRENAIGNDHPVGQFLYDAGVSSAESLVTMLTSQAALGGVPAAVGKGLSLVPFAANAYDSSYEDAVNRGFGEKQAQMYGLASGLIEAGTEIFSLDRIWDMASAKKLGRNLVSNAIIQAGIEGTEEVASELGGRLADYLAVEIGGTGKTQRQLDIEEYMQDHPWASSEEAANYAAQKFAKEVGLAGLSGMASAVLDTSVASMVGAYRSKYGDNLTGAISDRFKNLKVEGDTEYENMLRENKAKYENNPTQYLADNYKVNSEDDARVKQGLEEIAQKEREGKGLSVSDKAFITKNVVDNREQFNKEFLENLYDTGEDSIVPYKYRDVKTEVTEDQARTMLAEAAQSGDPKAFIDAQRKVRNSTVDEVAKHAEELIDFYAGSAMEHGITKEDIGKALIAEKQAYIAGITGEELNKDNLTPEAQIAYNDGKMDALKEATRTTIENKDALNTDVTTKEGNTVTLKGVFTSDGIMTDGGAVKLENIDLDENKATNKAYHFADNYESVNVKNNFINNIKDGQNIENYNRDYGRVYDSALAGLSLENVKKESLTELDDDQIENIYETAVVERQARATDSIAEALNGVKGTGKGKAFNESSSTDPKMLKIAEMMARATKYDIHIVDEVPQNKGARGVFLKNDNAVYVRADDFMRSLGHEFSHYIETYNKGEYDSLRGAVANYVAGKIGSDTFMNAMKGYGVLYNTGANQQLSIEDMSAEAFNDIVPIILESKQGSKAFAKYLAENYGADEARTFGEKIKDVMDNLAGTIRKYLSNTDHPTTYAKEMKKYADELGQFADQFIKALDGAIQNYNKGVQKTNAKVSKDVLTINGQEYTLNEKEKVLIDSEGREIPIIDMSVFDTSMRGTPNQSKRQFAKLLAQYIKDTFRGKTFKIKSNDHEIGFIGDSATEFSGSRSSFRKNNESMAKKANIAPRFETVIENAIYDRHVKNTEAYKPIKDRGLDKYDVKVAYQTDDGYEIYAAKMYVGLHKDGKEYFYDILSMDEEKEAIEKEQSSASANGSVTELESSSSDLNIAQKGQNSKVKLSLAEDSSGRELSEGQQEYFKNSQIREKNGNLLVMHHGTASYGFDVFDIKKAKAANLYGRGFYFSKDSSHAGQYGQQYDVYLNIVNPLQPGTKSITKNQLLKFINAVANNEDYGIENYGQGATPQSVLDSVWGKDDFSMLQDINATCIGDFAGAVKEFNRINKTSYDGINTPTETVAFYPNQIKDINNKKPTNADSMRFSLSEEDAKDIKKKAKKSKAVDVTKDLVAVHNLGEQQLIESLKLQGLPSPSIAIIRSGMMHDKYGAISLIFKSDTIDPENSTRNKVYGGDGWTPTFPAIEVKINRSVAEKIWDKIDSLVSAAEQRSIGYANVDTDNLQDKANRNRGDVVDAYKDNKALQYAFLKDNGIDIDVPSEDVRLDEHWTNEQILAVLDIIKDRKQAESLREGYRAYESNPELVEELRQALNQQFRQKYVNKGNAKLFDKDLYEELSFNDFDHLTKGVFKYYREGIQQQMDSQAARAAIQEQIKEHEAEYDKWLRNLFDGIIEKRGLRNNKDVFLPSGNRRSWEALHDDYTLENIVKIMNQQEERGEAAFFSQSAIQALSTKNFKSLDEIRKSKGQLRVETEEEHEKRITEQSEKFTEICNEIMDKSESNSFIAFGRASDAIAEAIRRYRTVQGIDRELRQWRGLNIKSDTAQKIVDLMNEIAENPTGYFEAKPKRAVWLDEIKKAVIPNNVSEDTIKALDDAGIPYEMYRYEDEGQRRDIIAAMEDVKFSLSEDSEGRELSDDQVKYFKNSKAVDAKGRLLELYHGTEAQAFSVFSTPGIWVTPDKELATEYAGEWNNWRNERDDYGHINYETNGMEPEVYGDKYLRMYKVYANVTNPVFLGELNRTLPDDYAGMEFDTLGIKTEEQFDKLYDLVQQHIGDKVWQLTETKEFIDLMKELGYDGMFASENGHRTICVFDSNQLKKVDNLTPTEDKDIRYSISENSNGDPLSEGQQKYFQNSQALDEEGRLLSLYHGTVNAGFTDFNDKDYIYLSTSKAVAKQFSDDPFGVGKIFDTRTGEGSIYNVYANITNPLIVDGMRSIVKGKVNADIEYQENTGRYNLTLTKKDGTKYTFTTYDLSDYFDDKTVDQINNYFDRHPARGLYDVTKYSVKGKNVDIQKPSPYYDVEFNGESMGTDAIADYAKEHGYDGVIVRNVVEGSDATIHGEATTDVIAFSSKQIKSVDNLNPTSSKDIRYSISENSDGEPLSEGQQRYFDNSKVVDGEGRLMVMYHGTNRGGFTVFDNRYSDDGRSFFFTDSPVVAESYSGTTSANYKVYLNIENPLVIDAQGNRWNELFSKADAIEMDWDRDPDKYPWKIIDFSAKRENGGRWYVKSILAGINDSMTYSQIADTFGMNLALIANLGKDVEIPLVWVNRKNGTIHPQDTRSASAIAKASKYDGVIFKNLMDMGGEASSSKARASTVAIAFNPEQIKSVYNTNPTSSKDIRFSFEDEGGWIDFDEVLGESMSEEKAVDILEKGMEALKNKDVDVPKLRTLALKIRNEYGSSYNANKLADDLRKAFAYMQTEDHVDYQTMMGILKDIARPVIEEAGEKVGEEEYKHFLDYFKGKKIKLTSTQKEEVRHTFGSYGAYRNAMMPITISDNGEFTLDQLWDEMVQHGGYMLDIDANEGDMPINLLDTLQAMRPYVRNDFGGDTEDLAKDLAMRIVEEYIQGESAKEMHKELTEYRNRLKKDYQERLKDLKGRANAEVLARNKRRAEEKAERQKARDLKVKIKQNANKLYTWAVKPTEGKSVPHNMMVPVMQFLQAIDFVDPVITVSDDGKYHIRLFDRVDYEDGHKKFIYKDLVGDTREDVLRQFNEAIGRGEGTKEQRSWTDKMQGIRDIYNKVLNDTDFEDTDMDFLMQTLDAQGLAEEFDDLLSRHKGQASMNNLSSKELELINNIIQNIFHAVNQGNKAFSQPSVDIVNLAQSTMKDAEGKEIKSRNRFMEGLHKMLRLDNVTPRTFFKLLGKRGSEVYKFLRGGLNQEIIDLKKASEFMEEAMKGINAKTWTGRSATIHEIPVSEGTIRLTDAQIMGLYMTIRRNGGKDRIKGGVKIDDIRTKGRPIQQKAMHLTDADIEKIEAILTPEQIALAKKMQQYMAKDCSEQGNDTSMRLYGFKKFTDDTYYPWTVDKDTVATTNTSENIPMFTGIERSGFTKQLKEGATNPLVIRDIFDVFTDHVSQMAAYHGYAASVKDTLRWMNYRERSDADGFVNWHTNKKAINDLTGSKQGVGYIRNLLLDINKANKSQYIGNFTDLLIGNYKAAAVGANLRVVAQQPTAYFRALNMIDPKYLLTVNPATAIKNIKRSQEQSPISWWKSKGYYETNLGQPIKEIVTGIASPAEKAKDIMMAPAGWADDFTWGFLYTAVEKEQRDLLKGQNLTAEQFRQAVNDRFDEVVDNTQVVDSTLHRSQYMRSTDRLNKIQTAFMAEPTKSYNMLLEAFLEDRNDKSGKRTTRAIAAFLLSSLATSAAAAVVDAMRKAKDDEDWWEVWLKNLQENAADNINPFNLLPVVKDVSAGIYNLLTGTSTFGQSGNRFDIEAISSIMSAVQMIPKLIEGESNKTGYGAALTMIKPISQITGIPVYNLTKDTVALYNTFFDNIETTINSGSTAKNEKKKNFVSDVNRERSEKTLDEGIVDAIENGVSIYDLKGAVRSEYKNKYFDAYAEGNTEEAQAIAERAARAYARMGMSDEDIDAEINEWQEETITYALLDKAIASGEGIEEEIRHVQEGKADEKIIKHIMDRFSDTIAYEDVHETESDWRGNVEKALQAIDPTLTYDTANEEAMQKKAEKEAEQAAQEEKKGYKADFFASVESKNGTAGRKALDGLKAMGVDAKSAKTMVSTQYHDAWKEAKTPAEKQKAKSDWMSAYKLVCNYYGVEYKDLDKTWSDWEKDQ